MKVFDFLIMYKLATNYLVFHQTNYSLVYRKILR